MKLHVGERLPGSGPPDQPGGYLVTAALREAPWGHLYAARKILYNFDFAGQRCRESDEAEWLDVLLRTCGEGATNDDRAAVRDEVRQVLAGRAGGLWPEPVDLVETEDGEPVAVLAQHHGLALPQWLETQPSAAQRLAVLGELLAFVEAAHQGGLLLNGLGPQAVVIDAAGWPGYLASDAVVPLGAPPDGRRFPPERYPAGFAAPECLNPCRPRDQRTDLFAWAALVVYVMTGERGAVTERLAQALAGLSAQRAAQALAVDGAAATWPHNLVRVVERALALDPRDRPRSVAELRRWLAQPPPAAVLAAIALATPGGPVRVGYEWPAATGPMEVVVRRGETTVATAAAGAWLTIPAADASGLRIHLRSAGAGDDALSAGVDAPLVEPVPDALRRFAEQSAYAAVDGEPPAVALLFRALKWTAAADALLGSTSIALRLTAARRAQTAARQPATAAEAEQVLWRALADAEPAVCRVALDGLLTGKPSAARVVRLFEQLASRAGPEADEALALLQQRGADAAVLAAARQALADRPARCPECAAALPARDLPAHLVGVHGYVEVGDTALPREAALGQLWDRVFSHGDRAANERLLQLLPGGYAAALEAQLRRRAGAILAARWQELPRLTHCLRATAAALPLVGRALLSEDARVREIVQEVLLAELGARLAGNVTALEIRGRLDELCPAEALEAKVQLCRVLPRAGVPAEPVTECLARLEQELPVACRVCGARVARFQLETHLRRAHRVYELRGQVRTLEETLAALLDAVCDTTPDTAAWATLEIITREEYPAEAEGYLATWLGQRLANVSETKRPRVTTAVAETIAATPGGPRMAVLLSGTTSSAGQEFAFHLALEIAGRLPVPVAPEVLAAVTPRVGDKRLSVEVRLRSVAQLLRSAGPAGPAAVRLLHTFVAHSGKAVGIERLQRLEQLAGKMAAIDQVSGELESQLRMSCPRCGVELRRAEMAEHLWQQHRLMLDGRRVRDPWRMIEDWLEDFRVEGDSELLTRCRRLADRLDPAGGSPRLRRLMLQHGIEDAGARQELLERARAQGASVCPHCFAPVPAAASAVPPVLTVERGLIEANGYRVEVSDDGFVPRLEMETPRAVLYEGREPGRHLTKLGMLFLFVGPLLAAAVLLAVVPVELPVSHLIVAGLFGGMALLVSGMVLLAGNPEAGPLDRVIDDAWDHLVPLLLDENLTPADQAFVAALAVASRGHGDADTRGGAVVDARAALEKAVVLGAPASYLGAVWRLALDDDDADALPRLADQAYRAFDGGLPLGYLATLLADLDGDEWTPAARSRLRVLLAARAFDAGLELRELLDLGAACPALADVLDLKRPDYLAHLRLLHSLQHSQPWERIGRAATIFDIALDPAASDRHLGRRPDLLLAVDDVSPVYLCARGVGFEGAWFFEPPRQVEIICHNVFDSGHYLVIGPHKFRYEGDPTALAGRLEKWFRFFFQELRPRLEAVHRARSPSAAKRLLLRNGSACPECRRRVLPVPGELGIAAEPTRHQAALVLPARVQVS
jgi:hypothetical protein